MEIELVSTYLGGCGDKWVTEKLNWFPFIWRHRLTQCSIFTNDVGSVEREFMMATEMAPGWQAHHTCPPIPSYHFASFTRFFHQTFHPNL
jgi:hypothetical protein